MILVYVVWCKYLYFLKQKYYKNQKKVFKIFDVVSLALIIIAATEYIITFDIELAIFDAYIFVIFLYVLIELIIVWIQGANDNPTTASVHVTDGSSIDEVVEIKRDGNFLRVKDKVDNIFYIRENGWSSIILERRQTISHHYKVEMKLKGDEYSILYDSFYKNKKKEYMSFMKIENDRIVHNIYPEYKVEWVKKSNIE